MSLSPNVLKVKPSITLTVTARANAMKAQGIDVIALSAGEPDFDTPKHIADAAVEAIRAGFTKYTPSSGIPDLKKAVCDKFRRDNGLITPIPGDRQLRCEAQRFLAISCSWDPATRHRSGSLLGVLSGHGDSRQYSGHRGRLPENGLKITPEQLRRAITRGRSLWC